jgi:hypothetical protein
MSEQGKDGPFRVRGAWLTNPKSVSALLDGLTNKALRAQAVAQAEKHQKIKENSERQNAIQAEKERPQKEAERARKAEARRLQEEAAKEARRKRLERGRISYLKYKHRQKKRARLAAQQQQPPTADTQSAGEREGVRKL